MKNNKAPGEDSIVIETIREGGEELLKIITILFNKCLKETKTSATWNNAFITIMHKKGNIAENIERCIGQPLKSWGIF